MIHSTWGDWFVKNEIEAADVSGLSIWYLGCNTFVLRTPETTVYLDPYFGDGDPPFIFRMIPVPMNPADATQCDAILVTHEHLDHMHEPSYRPLVDKLGSDVYAPSASYTDPDHEPSSEIPDEQTYVIEEGDIFEVGDLRIHVRGGNDPDAIEEVSFVIEHDSGTFFNSGDSRPTEVFYDIGSEFDIDVGTLTYGTTGQIYQTEDEEVCVETWYSSESDVIEIANALQLERLVPCHYDMWKGVRADPNGLITHASSFDYPRIIDVVEIGDRFNVNSPGIAPLGVLSQ